MIKTISLFGLFIIVFMAMSGCSQIGYLKPGDPAYAEAEQAWKLYGERVKSQGAGDQAFWVKGSLTYTSSGRTSRVIAEIWGDNDLPARLNVSSPMGVNLLLCREDKNGFIAFAPDREEAWSFSGAAKGLASLGMASAFSLPVLAKMSFGNIDQSLLATDFESAKKVPGKGFEFFFAGNNRASSLMVDAGGRPLKLTGRPGDRFLVSFDDYKNNDDVEAPGKIIFEGRKATAEIIVKDRELRPDRWPERSLKMEIPDGVLLKKVN